MNPIHLPMTFTASACLLTGLAFAQTERNSDFRHVDAVADAPVVSPDVDIEHAVPRPALDLEIESTVNGRLRMSWGENDYLAAILIGFGPVRLLSSDLGMPLLAADALLSVGWARHGVFETGIHWGDASKGDVQLQGIALDPDMGFGATPIFDLEALMAHSASERMKPRIPPVDGIDHDQDGTGGGDREIRAALSSTDSVPPVWKVHVEMDVDSEDYELRSFGVQQLEASTDAFFVLTRGEPGDVTSPDHRVRSAAELGTAPAATVRVFLACGDGVSDADLRFELAAVLRIPHSDR